MKKGIRTSIGIKILTGVIALLLLLAGAFLFYVSDYYHADAAVAASSSQEEPKEKNGALLYGPEDAETALIFYPGGKVEYTAYQPLMEKIAEKGILCILPKMPFNLAVSDVNAADKYITDFPQVSHWYVGGHSLGGSMAAAYATEHSDNVEGVVLLASYGTTDLTMEGMRVLSIYGSEDRVLNRESYMDNKSNLPKGFSELVIQGGNHGGFGCYGQQKGDGEASISQDRQQEETGDAVTAFLLQ